MAHRLMRALTLGDDRHRGSAMGDYFGGVANYYDRRDG